METAKRELQSQVIKLSTESLETFCEDISAMFDLDMNCQQQEIIEGKLSDINKNFKKLSAVNSVQTHGILDGGFHLIFDKDGLFTLAGVIVMLPEQRILENRRRGSAKEAEEMSDSFCEAGNLLVGSWDRIFRENMEGHGHFLQSKTFIGNPWDKTEESMTLPQDAEIVFMPYEMTVGSYPGFNCGVIFPKSILSPSSKPEVKTEPENQPQAVVDQVADLQNEVAEPQASTTDEQVNEEVTSEQPGEVEADVSQPLEDQSIEAPVAETVESNDQETAAPEKAEQAKDFDSENEDLGGEISGTIERMTKSQANLPGEYCGQFAEILAEQIMQTELLWGPAEDSVQQAMTKMQQADIGYMLVGSDGVLEGIVSNQDIASAVSIYLKPMFARWRRHLDDATLQIRVQWIMTRPVTTVKADTPLPKILEIMQKSGVKSLPIVDEEGKTVGLVTAFDIFKVILEISTGLSTTGKTATAIVSN